MADASDGHVLGSDSKVAEEEKESSPERNIESLNNGTGGGPSTPAEPQEDRSNIGDDDDQMERDVGCKEVEDADDYEIEGRTVAEVDADAMAAGDNQEADDVHGSNDAEVVNDADAAEEDVGVSLEGQEASTGIMETSRDEEEEDEVLQLEVPDRHSRESSQVSDTKIDDSVEKSPDVKAGETENVEREGVEMEETESQDQTEKNSPEFEADESMDSAERKGPRTPATPLQDETSNSAPKAIDEEQEKEEDPTFVSEGVLEASPNQEEESAGQNEESSGQVEESSGQGENSSGQREESPDVSLNTSSPLKEAEPEVMDIDDTSADVTADSEKGLETIAEDVEMDEADVSAQKSDEIEEADTSTQEKNVEEDKPDSADAEKSIEEPPLLTEGESDKDKIESEAPSKDTEDSDSNTQKESDSKQDEKDSSEKESIKEASKSEKKAEDDDDDVMVIEDDKPEPEAIVLDDDDDDPPTDSKKDGDSTLATMDSSNDTGLQIASVTGGGDSSGLRIASVSGAAAKPTEEPLKTKIKQEKITPPSTPVPPTTRKQSTTSTPTGGSGKKSSKMQSCIVCGKVGRCKYNIVRNGDIKHLCDDVCFRKFRANPTMFLKNTAAQQKSQAPTKPAQKSTAQQKSGQPLTRSAGKSPAKSNSQADYKSCTVCQLMNINTQKPFVKWMNTDFCSEVCLSKYQSTLNSACSYCTCFVAPNARPLHCLQVGTDFKTFCSAKCHNEFKKRLRLCTFCHTDLSTTKDSFCAPIGHNKFRDFCSKSCLKKYEEKTDIEIIGMESTNKKGPVQKCAVCSKNVPIKHNVKLNGVLNRLCSDPCLSAFQYANKLAMNTCDNCGGLCPAEEVVSHFIQFEGQQKRFCKDTCVNTFRAKHRKVVPCAWCGSKKTNFDMIERVDSNNKYQLFCSLNCLSLYRVNLQAKSNQAVMCDHCRKFVPAQYHLTMSDASVRNFCSYNCVMVFQSQFGANSKNASQPTIHSQQRVQLQNKPSTRGAAANTSTQSQGQPNSFPIISNVVSLAPQGQKQQTVNIKSTTPVPVVVGSGNKQSVSTSTTQQIIIQPPPPKQMKNKSLLCKPFVQTKATSCRPHTLHKEVQTDEQEGKPVLVPIPIPIFVPCPLAMYAAPTPQLVPFAVPIPVPVFIPTAKKSADKILKHIKEIQEKIPSDPLEAELLMMAEAVAGGGNSDSDSGNEAEPFSAPAINKEDESEAIEPLIDHATPGNGEEDLVQMALRMAEEITGPVLDLETSVEPMAVNTDPPPVRTPPEPAKPAEDEDEEYVPPRETRSRRGKRGSRGRGGRQSKRAKIEVPEPEPIPEPSPPPAAPPQPPPDANMHLKFTYGVNAWRHWVVHKNTLLEKVSKRGSGKLKLFKTDLLQCTADELNYSLCLFVKEVRKPNGEEYSPDSIYYLCLGIQQYLYENSRIDNIFTDLYYEKFTECLNDVLGKYEPKVNASGQMLCRIEEEHIWECKQLGAHSPYVLLNTLIYFNTKHFMLKSTDEHMKLSFAHILKHWKKGGPGTKVVTGQGRSVSLRYYCLNPNGQNSQKKPKEGIPVYETSENLENPLRCPVKLYEFYLSKCPESIKNRNDMFYLVPERSCVPDSPVWYSTQSISGDSMSKMLNRILLVREIQEAHIHAQPIYV